MKRYLLGFIMLLVLLLPQSSWAAQTSSYPNPYRETTWNKFTDSMHTIGQSGAQARKTKTRLHAARTKARLHSIYVANQAKHHHAWTLKQNSQNSQ